MGNGENRCWPGLAERKGIAEQDYISPQNCDQKSPDAVLKALVLELENHQLELEVQNQQLQTTERQLQIALRQYQQLYELAPIAYFTLDSAGVVTEPNLAATMLLQTDRERIANRPFVHLVLPQHQTRFLEYLNSVVTQDRPQDCEIMLKREDGMPVDTLLASVSVNRPCGSDRQFLIAAVNMTERRLLEDERMRNNKLESLSVLAGGIAHDFNNILTVIQGGISLARLQASPGSSQFRILAETEEACHQARNLASQLLVFSKGGEPIKKTISIEKIVNEAATFAMRGSNTSCEIKVVPDLYLVNADSSQISQVINNLVINAHQSMSSGGKILITCTNETTTLADTAGDYVKVLIRDQGVGIPEDVLEHIFDPYFTTKPEGNGLGLATAYSIIKRHGGQLTVESKAGEGTSFQILIPACTDVQSGAGEYTPYLAEGSGRVLVMDDQKGVRKMVSVMLDHLGYECVLCGNGAEAMRLFRESTENGNPFTHVLMDLTVPGGIGGKEAVQEILKMDPTVRTIVFSGYADGAVLANYREYGFNAALCKPFSIEQLGEVLAKA
ncbi:MAG: ATP-binding protein [Solirubrobacterales bacterium]